MGVSSSKLFNLIPPLYLSKDLENPAQQKDYFIYTLKMRERQFPTVVPPLTVYMLQIPQLQQDIFMVLPFSIMITSAFEWGPRFAQFLKSIIFVTTDI